METPEQIAAGILRRYRHGLHHPVPEPLALGRLITAALAAERARADERERESAALLAELSALRASLSTAQERERAMRGALEPFARFAEAYGSSQDNNDDDTAVAFNGVALTLGDLRRARAALAPTEGA
jgi:hypothetical protein